MLTTAIFEVYNPIKMVGNADNISNVTIMKKSLKILLLSALVSLVVIPVQAANYYVAPTGDNDNDGLDSASAWLDIDAGDAKGIISPGDTINVYPGSYIVSDGISLSTDGTEAAPIVYCKTGSGSAVLDGDWQGHILLTLEGSHTVIDGLEIYNVKDHAVDMIADSCTISNCHIHQIDKDGIRNEGIFSLIAGNIISHVGDHGIECRDGGTNTRVYNNTIYSITKNGIEIQGGLKTARFFNNIIFQTEKGIHGDVENICGFNDVWNNNSANYDGGVVDSAGGISSDPMISDTTAGDFSLLDGSPCINAGLDLGFTYSGSSPDMGAVETSEVDILEVSSVYDSMFADRTYQFEVAGFDNFGNSVTPGTINWSHTFSSGSIDASGLFTPDLIGTGEIIATEDSSGTADTTVTLEVYAGDLDSIFISPNRDTVSADSARQFTALGYDLNGNPVTEIGTIEWAVLLDIGTIDNAGLFEAVTTGDGFITATSDLGPVGQSDTVTVIPGDLDSLDVSPSDDIVVRLTSLQYSAEGYDADGNLYKDLTDSVTWTTTDADGGIAADGEYTAGNIVGDYYNFAEYGSFKDSGHVVVTGAAGLSYVRIEYEDGTPVSDTSFTTDEDSTAFFCRAYDAGDGLISDVVVNWFLLGIDSIGYLTKSNAKSSKLILDTPGTGKIAVEHVSGAVDTTGIITCTAGIPTEFIIVPDTAVITSDSSLQFSASSVDADGNPSDPAAIPAWSVIGGIGTIDGSGLFTPTAAGTGNIVATGGGISDTTGDITVTSGQLTQIEISPDSIDIGLGDTVQFSASGYDAGMNEVDPGDLTWSVLGRVGTIDSDGKFISNATGSARVAVTSSLDAVTDTSGFIDVEELLVSSIPLGFQIVNPGEDSTAVLAFRIHNYFDEDKSITSMTVRDHSQGYGSVEQRITNVDSVALYLDLDNDSLFSASDSLISKAEYNSSVAQFNFDALTIESYSGYNFFVNPQTALFACDNDTLDLIMYPAGDIETGDATIPSGPVTLNSLGHSLINGLIKDQVTVVSTGNDNIVAGDTLYNVLTLDIPRNGYRTDTLNIFRCVNLGTASSSDIDSLVLFKDDGDNLWEGPAQEIREGRLTFTGSEWSLSGIAIELPDVSSRFFVTAALSEYPANGRTIAMSIPLNGMEMKSDNDGPHDAPVIPVDTVTIQSTEEVAVSAVNVTPSTLIPGKAGGPIGVFRLRNSYGVNVLLDSLRLTSLAVDPDGAAQAELDSQFDSLEIYLKKDAVNGSINSGDSLLASALIDNGSALFDLNGLTIAAAGGEIRLAVKVYLNLENGKNANTINFSINSSADIYPQSPRDFNGSYPVKNGTASTINAFSAQAIQINSFAGETIFGNQTNQIGLDFTLPINGYAPDILNRIRIVNAGTLNESDALSSVKLYKDKNGNGFSPDDILISEFTYKTSYWEISGLSHMIESYGTRYIVTFDVQNSQFDGGTLQFRIPVGGILYESGMNGPDDSTRSNPEAHLVFPSDRVTVISIPSNSYTVYPGTAGNSILTFALYNGYTEQSHTLKSLNFSNISKTVSGTIDADYEVGQISLYFDNDKSRTMNGDTLIGSGYFGGDELQITGLNVILPPESLSYFFVQADLPYAVTDGDSLAISVEDPSGFVFQENANINGDIPLSSGGFLVVDGSVAEQYDLLNVPPQTLSPGDTSILIFGFNPAVDGSLEDTLTSITFENVGTSAGTDLSNVELWLDANQDGSWQGSDTYLGIPGFSGGQWIISGLNVEIGSVRPLLFVLCDVSSGATPDATVQFVLPVDGCQYTSSNDGPIDESIVSPGSFTISNSGLKISHAVSRDTYSIGQTVRLDLIVTNVLAAPLSDIYSEIVDVSAPSLIQLDSSDTGPAAMNAGESTTFRYYYTAVDTGSVVWRMHAFAESISDTSSTIETDTTRIQEAPDNIYTRLINSIPTAVTRGQSNVFPLSLEITHTGTGGSTAPIRLDSLRIHIEDASGSGIEADSIFSRIILSSGYNNLVIHETVPDQESVLLDFTDPLLIYPGQKKILSLQVDIDSLATADAFAVSFVSSGSIPAVDDNTGLITGFDGTVAFPLKTAVCSVNDPSQILTVSSDPVLSSAVNFGQSNVGIIDLKFGHPGLITSSQIQLSGMTFCFVDSNDVPLAASNLVDRVRLLRQGTAIASLAQFTGGQTDISLPLNSPLTLSPGEEVDVRLTASIKSLPTYSNFGIRITDSVDFVVRDLSSGSLLTAATDTSLLSTGSVFPISSGWARLMQPASACSLCVVSGLPASIVGGVDSISLLDFAVDYPYATDYSSLALKNIYVNVTDSTGQPLTPDLIFDRIGYRALDGTIIYQQFVTTSGGQTVFDLGSGIVFAPGDNGDFSLVADIETDVPYDNFNISISGTSALDIEDMTDTTHYPGFVLSGSCQSGYPYTSPATKIYLPAGRPVIDGFSGAVSLAYPGQPGAVFMKGNIRYSSDTPKGDLSLNGLTGRILKMEQSGTIAAQASAVFDSIYLMIDTQIVAGTSAFDGDSLVLTLDSTCAISIGNELEFSLKCNLKSDAPAGNYLVRFDDSSFMAVTDMNLGTAIPVIAVQGTYPLYTGQISVSAASLEHSFTSYPNPFNPTRGEAAVIGYVLPEDAYVDIEIFSITGDGVSDVIRSAFKAAGPHQEDRWVGNNDLNLKVLPGTYYCRITAKYVSGATESFRRKISIIR